jgi:hypothetical protein
MQNGKLVEAAEITVQFVNPPKPGKKWGSVKSTAGDYYGGPPAMLAQFQPGETCKIEYTLGGNDGTLKALKQKLAGIPAVLQRPVAPPPRASTNPKDSEQMFVTAMMKEVVKGMYDAGTTTTEMITAVNSFRDVYRNTFGSPAKQQMDHDFGDEIPF